MEGKKRFSIIIAVFMTACILFNLAAWKSAAFSDFYVTEIFPYITGLYGRFTSLFSFSVGEILLCVLVLLVAFVVLFILIHTIILFIAWVKKEDGRNGSAVRRVFDRISSALYRTMPVLMVIVCTIMSLNCFALYHTSKINIYNDEAKTEYELQELADFRDFVVRRCNELSVQVPHDDKGNVIYEGDMEATAIASMQKISNYFPRLDGYYVTPKALHFSGFMSQQYMQGYYFPFSMEANYNDEMSIMNKPFTMCHELAHTHGYIYEDEANFLGFLACVNSDDPVFQYSGYLGILNYVNNDFYNSVSKSEYDRHVRISKRVRYDNQFLTPEAWQEVERTAIVKTATVKKAASTFIDTNLKVNGVLSGKASYCEVVALLLDYYYNEPEYAQSSSGDSL